MRNKTALVTGLTGGIGGAFAKELLRRGYDVYLPVRSMNKPEVQECLSQPNAHIALCDVSKPEQTDQYFRSLLNDGVHIDLFVLAAGDFRLDGDKLFSGETIEEKRKAAIPYLHTANVTTKETVYKCLHTYFGEQEKDMVGIVISSHAAHFTESDEFYYSQVGYVLAMREVSATAKKYADRFKQLILKEPARISTPGLHRTLAPNGEEKDPAVFVDEVLKEISQEKIAA